MKPRSAKNKGQRFSKEVRDKVCDELELPHSEIRVVPSGVPGMDLWLSEKAKARFPFAVEAKCQETASIWAWMEQAEQNQTEELRPIVVFRRNHSKTYCCLEFETFVEIFKTLNHLKTFLPVSESQP